MVERQRVRVRENGQVTIPAKVRRRLGLKKGDVLEMVDTPEGILITSQEVVVSHALDSMGEVLRAQGATLDELIESGRNERSELIRELYGLDIDGSP